MPLTDHECPECGKVLHTDDLIAGVCLGGDYYPRGSGCGSDLPDEVSW